MRQVALALDEGRALDGATAEVVQELRSAGGYPGHPGPVAGAGNPRGRNRRRGTPNPIQTRPIIDRLFPGQRGGPHGRADDQHRLGRGGMARDHLERDGGLGRWRDGQRRRADRLRHDRPRLNPDHNLGTQMRITRKALKQSGAALEQAVRRDMNGAMGAAMDQAVFLGTGANGQPLGVIPGAATYGITATAVDAAGELGGVPRGVVGFMAGNAATGPGAVAA